MAHHEFDLPTAGPFPRATDPKDHRTGDAPADAELDAEIGVEYVLLCCFTGPDRELPRRALQQALGQFGLRPVAARHVIRTTALLVPTERRRCRLADPAPQPDR